MMSHARVAAVDPSRRRRTHLAGARRTGLGWRQVLATLAALLALAAPPAALPSRARAGGPRAGEATAPFVTAPYLASPLGEGDGRDPDPRLRLDAFDCMTFVETAVALGSASSVEQAAAALDDVRYRRGRPSLAARNHEVLSQWIPANVAKGWIADATVAAAGPLARRVEQTYTAESWALVRASGRAIAGLPWDRLPVGRFAIDVVPPADVPAVAPRLPHGALVFVVRADAPGRATRITHAGLLVRGPRGPRVRHATSSRRVRRVIEEPLAVFVRREQQAYPRWPLDGFAFYALRDNSARVHALAKRAARSDGAPAGERSPTAAPL
jgi:hypothetical protein